MNVPTLNPVTTVKMYPNISSWLFCRIKYLIEDSTLYLVLVDKVLVYLNDKNCIVNICQELKAYELSTGYLNGNAVKNGN